MSTIKITALPALTTPDTNKANTIFVVVDTSSGVPTTKQMSLANLEFAVDDTGVLARAHANSAFNTANAAYTQANIATPAFAQANTANNIANAALILATTANTTANLGYNLANTANITAAAGLSLANTANITATAALSLANTANIVSAAAYTQANIATPAFNKANDSFIHANSAYNLANTIVVTANIAYSNIIFAQANSAYNVANLALITANTANAKSSNSVSKFGDTMVGDLNITTGNLKITGTGYANVAGKLTVGPSGFTSLPDITAQLTGSSVKYIQMNQQNIDYRGSGDFVITADNGDDGNNYIDMGVAGSGYSDSNFAAYLPNDGWVIVQGKEGQGYGGNLILGTSATNTDIIVLHGGTGFSAEKARFVRNQGLVLKYNTVSTSNATGTLVVQGGIGANGNIRGDAIYANGVDLAVRLTAAYTLANNTANTTNTAYIAAAFATANTANATALAAFNAANTATGTAANALLNSTSGGAVANVANATANYANTVSNTAFVLANTLNVTIVSVSTVANTGNITANAAFAKANLAWTYADTVNTALQTVNTTAISAFSKANIATVNADASFVQANIAFNLANTINATYTFTVNQSNTAFYVARDVYVKTNAAFDVANTALALGGLAVTLESSANASLIRANAAFDQANIANSMAFSAYASGNTNATNISTITTNVGTIWTQANTTVNVAQGAFNLANAISNVATQQTNTYFVDPNRTDTYTELGTILYPFKTIANANTAAVTSGHNDSNPAYIVLMGNVTENVAFNNGGIFLTGAFSSGTHSGINLTGQITCNGSSASISDNHFSISNLRIIGPTNGYGILANGTNPQRVFMRDLWIDAAGSGACVRANGNNSSVIHLNSAHLTHSNTGDVYGIQVANGVVTMTDIETSGSITVASVSPGANLVLTGSEIDANNAAAIEVYGGTVTVGTSILTNANTTGHGIALKTAGSVALVQNVLFNVQSGTNARAVYGVTGSACYYQYLSFYPGSNSKMSSNVSNTALTTTFTFTAP